MQPLEYNNIRLAATVMLIRDGTDGIDVYMVKRPARGAFPDLHVFPGGKVEVEDYAPTLCYGVDEALANSLLGVEAGGIRYWAAVARECFEECAVLLATRDGLPLRLDDANEYDGVQRLRRRMLNGELSFEQVCQSLDAQVGAEYLAYFSHWVTPEIAPHRFDTRFFLAAMPEDQRAFADTTETTDEHWVSPRLALEYFQSGRWQMIDPTLRSLETLSQFDTVAHALEAVRRADHLMPLTPELQQQGMQALR